MPTAKRAAFNYSIRFTVMPESRALPAGRRSTGSWWDRMERTTVGSASEVENLIRHLDHHLHLRDLVTAHDVSTSQDGRCHGRGRRTLQQQIGRYLRCLRQKRLARWAHHNRTLQSTEFVQPCQYLRVLLPAFSEAEPRVDDDPNA